MTCLYILTPRPGCLPEEAEQLGGLVVTKVHRVGEEHWKVSPPACVTFCFDAFDKRGELLPAGKTCEIYPHESWLVPLDGSTRRTTQEVVDLAEQGVAA